MKTLELKKTFPSTINNPKQLMHLTASDCIKSMGLEVKKIGKFFISSGTMERLNPIFQTIDNPELVGAYQQYEVYNGNYSGNTISFGNGGQYAPDCAIMGEIYYEAGVKYLVRIGSCGSLQEDIDIGDIIIVTGAVRDEGTTPNYLPEPFPAISDFFLTQTMVKVAEKLNIPFHIGISWTTDALLRESYVLIDQMQQLNVKSVDMISSSIFTVAHHYHKSAGILLAVSDNLITGEKGFFDPRFKEAERNIARIALSTAEMLNYD